ncbi:MULTISPECIES: acyltransferase family protein [unclassified Sphingobium]|uniref:acyltransferase family protein n=1 Tax=unclassified Sphingobium TaxID=2611147 RepID=UPI002224CA51|nr:MULTISPECIES: acyltransferase [unclassified Sphingobium]MCW2394204.1 peptidoglycan/LPS O-acetylase OafA/YrhL [Sphingobium sp. B8D3B]MCW2417718.1 peptidoglycan/LPS O-acetylase OafA/YrhL [Sphingobium sp. B8D3C]
MTVENSDTSASGRHRYVVLDSLRGIFACVIVCIHIKGENHISQLEVVKNGYLFVDFFFVLSGFVIASSYGRKLADGFPVGKFIWLRLGRIFPLHLFVLLLFLTFEIVFATIMPGLGGRKPFAFPFTIDDWFAQLALIGIFVGQDDLTWNGPSWSIAAEVWTYLIFALLMRYASRFMIPICIAIAICAPLALPFLTDRYMQAFHDGALVRCLYGFSLGVVAWHLIAQVEKLDLRGRDTLIELLIVGAIITFLAFVGVGALTLIAPYLFLIALLIFARERGAISALLRKAAFVRLGLLSYSIYMVHTFLLYRYVNVLSAVEKATGADLVVSIDGINYVGGGAWMADVLALILFAGVIAFAEITYRFVEKPGQLWAKSVLSRRVSGQQRETAPEGAPRPVPSD